MKWIARPMIDGSHGDAEPFAAAALMEGFVMERRPSPIARAIRTWRLRVGLTQEALAQALSVTYSTVNRWENGHVLPSNLAWRALEKLATDYGSPLQGGAEGDPLNDEIAVRRAAGVVRDFLANAFPQDEIVEVWDKGWKGPPSRIHCFRLESKRDGIPGGTLCVTLDLLRDVPVAAIPARLHEAGVVAALRRAGRSAFVIVEKAGPAHLEPL